MFLLIGLGCLAGDEPEILVKAGEIVEAALITKLFDTDPVVEKQFAGVAHTDLR
jgi:hypothetical protein